MECAIIDDRIDKITNALMRHTETLRTQGVAKEALQDIVLICRELIQLRRELAAIGVIAKDKQERRA